MSKGMSLSEFTDIVSHAVGCYIYFRDESESMHFVVDKYCELGFCSNIEDALVCYEDEAVAIKDICNSLFPDRVFHIVKLSTIVEWE